MNSISLEGDWARTAPTDILHVILDKLHEPRDHANFGLVCRDWHLARKNYIRKQPLLPMLMVPTELEDDGDQVIYSETERSLYSISTGKIYDSRLSVPDKFRYCGSSHGWLATVEEKTVIVLVNPFKNALTIRIPPLDFVSTFADEYNVFKVILTADPISNPDDYIVLAIYSFYRKLAFYKSSQKSWAYIDKSLENFHDVIMYKGLAYAVNHSTNDIISFDINSSSEPWELKKFKLREPINLYDVSPKYLVVSSQGELLQVQRNIDLDYTKFTISFEVFKLQLVQENGEGIVEKIEVKSLGNDAIFLGINHSFVVFIDSVTRRFRLCRPNSIYYTSEFYEYFLDWGHVHHKDVGCFNYEDKTYRPFYKFHPCQEWNKKMSRLLWITPSLQ